MNKPIKNIPNLETKRWWSKTISLTLLASLISLFAWWNLINQSPALITIWLFQSLPLLLLLPGILMNYYRSYSWLCFVLLFYFVKAVEGGMLSTAKFSDGLFIMLTVTLFISAMMASRWQQYSTVTGGK